MDIREQKGDITTAQNGYIFHGVNCQSKMGSGVALAISNKWPEVKEEYHRVNDPFVKENRQDELLGSYQVVSGVEHGLSVVNAFTQYTCGHGRRFASSMAIEWSLRHFAKRLSGMHIPDEQKRIHLPKIGGELGGLDFEKEVIPCIENCARWYPNVTFIIWEFEK